VSDPRVDVVGADRLPSEPVTPYVGKRARRDVVPDQVPTAPAATPYVGRRMARPASEPAVEAAIPAPSVESAPAAPYVGRRVARPLVEPIIEPIVETAVEPAVADAAVAFVKPIAPVALLEVPAPAASPEWTDWNLFAAESPEDTGQLPFALTEAFTGSLPRIEGEPGTDFSYDTTTALPAVRVGKRARVATRRTRLKVLPSLPALVGVAALAIAGFGAVTAGSKTDLVRAEAGPLRQAGALTGTSGTGSVGDRTIAVSRGSGRDANALANKRAQALQQIDKQTESRSAYLKKNQWELPVEPGVYHLTAGFGDYGLWAHLHTGLDFAAPTGTPIRAISNGVISSAQYDGAYGNKTVETLADGTELWYCHQVQFNVSPGDEVHAGDIIGYVGSTGHVTGPHVHIEVRPGGGDPVDPYPALVAHGLQP
jgi:hypothetical protein